MQKNHSNFSQPPIIVIGMGELGSVFARGFLKLGYPVQGVTRKMNLTQLAEQHPNPEAVLVAVGETDLANTLADLPDAFRQSLILIQNELLPKDWLAQNLVNPTVISVWFEKKKGMDSKQVVPSPVFGPKAELVTQALSTLDLEAYHLDSNDQLLFELVRKNLYILTTNLAGLAVGGNVGQLAKAHADLMQSVVQDVLKIQTALTGESLDDSALINAMLDAFSGDPEHKCMGRSAPARLKRALSIAQEHQVEVPTLNGLTRYL